MADRYRSIFFAIISLAVVWFLIVLLCLSQNDDLLQQQQQPWSSAAANLAPLSLALMDSTPDPAPSVHHHNNNNNDDYSNSNRTANYLTRHPESKKQLSRLDIIFYQLNTSTWEADDDGTKLLAPITKDQHLRQMLELRAINNPTDRYVKSEGDRLFAFNLLVSNRIGTFRPLPDTRHAKCKPNSWPDLTRTPSDSQTVSSAPSWLPLASNSTGQPPSRASIIICYYNEAPSALLRTIQSVLGRTARDQMQEIIVVDDSSEPEYDLTKVKPFIHDPLVLLVRTQRREGLIRARLFGSSLARGQILLFLDSHVEPNIGWMGPLMEMVRANKNTIACPIIDLINAETLVYSSSPLVRGGMNWALQFKWDSVPANKLMSYDDFVRPIESPTMAGGLFAIDRDFFNRIGSYDPGMELWGGENIELSLRTWMCGGKIVILPCSRVGHIFRKRRPYGPEPNQPDSLLLNSNRVARVWLDEHIDRFYEANPDAKYLVGGDVSKRLELRHKLGCNNFTWFLENVYPDLLASRKLDGAAQEAASRQAQRNRRPQRQVAANSRLQGARRNVLQSSFRVSETSDRMPPSGRSPLPKMVTQFQIQSMDSDLCIESKRDHTGAGPFTRLGLSRCAKIERNKEGEILLVGNSTILDQIWTETELHDLRLGPSGCLDVFKNLPLLRKCHNMGSFQSWSHNPTINQTSDTVNIFNSRAGLCLGVERVQIEEPIIMTICDKETYARHNYTATRYVTRHQSLRWRQTAKLQPGFRSKSSAGPSRPTSEYHLNQTRPSQSWCLLLVNHSMSTGKIET